jgi:hypothetical protein
VRHLRIATFCQRSNQTSQTNFDEMKPGNWYDHTENVNHKLQIDQPHNTHTTRCRSKAVELEHRL